MTAGPAHGGNDSSPRAATSMRSPTTKRSAPPSHEPPAEQLRHRLSSLRDAEIVEMYIRMVRNRDYLPIHEIGTDLWGRAVNALSVGAVLHTIGRYARDRLGVGG